MSWRLYAGEPCSKLAKWRNIESPACACARTRGENCDQLLPDLTMTDVDWGDALDEQEKEQVTSKVGRLSVWCELT